MRGLWVAFKVLLSTVLLAAVGLLLFMFTRKADDFSLLGVAAAVFFMVALLWVKPQPSSRELGLVGVVFSLGFLLLGSQILTGVLEYPRTCTGRKLWCEFENALYALGGPVLAAAPFLLLGVVLLFISAHMVVLRRLPR